MKKIITNTVSGCLAVCTFFLSGCSVLKPHSQLLNVNTIPTNAKLMINGNSYTSPAQVSVKRNKNVSIQAYKDGYQPVNRTVGTHYSTTFVLDAVGTLIWLVPVFGLIVPGAQDLDETDVTIVLPEKIRGI